MTTTLKPAFPILCIVLYLLSLPAFTASREPVRGRNGMVVSTDPLASDAGLEVLHEGGNAIDAAVAVSFALAVVHPQAGNLGGGGFMVIHFAEQGREVTVDYREVAPALARRNMYVEAGKDRDYNPSRVGHLASGVPGTVAGLHLVWEKYGRLPWKRLVEPAIRLAGRGFEVSVSLSEALKGKQELLSRFAESRRIFLRDGDFYEAGDLFVQPELERTLELIADEGPEAFYVGSIASLIAAEFQSEGGLITREDLRRYQPRFREPLRGMYRGYEIVSMGPPSSGGIVLVQMLNMLERLRPHELELGSVSAVHWKTEVMKRAFADRAQFLGDSDFAEIPTAWLISKEYARQRFRGIHPGWPTAGRRVYSGQPPKEGANETTHFSVMDRFGNGVATTTTLNGSFGSGVTVPGAGFLMNNEMDDFATRPGSPNVYGLIDGETNAVGPGKRPLSSMTPTVVKKDGKLYLLLGSPGGPTIINTVLNVLSNVIDLNFDIQEAVDAPRFHHQWKPDVIRVEKGGFSAPVQAALRKKGYQIEFRNQIGDAHCIMVDPKTGIYLGAPDPRSESKASKY